MVNCPVINATRDTTWGVDIPKVSLMLLITLSKRVSRFDFHKSVRWLIGIPSAQCHFLLLFNLIVARSCLRYNTFPCILELNGGRGGD